jgi:hypothetical protein
VGVNVSRPCGNASVNETIKGPVADPCAMPIARGASVKRISLSDPFTGGLRHKVVESDEMLTESVTHWATGPHAAITDLGGCPMRSRASRALRFSVAEWSVLEATQCLGCSEMRFCPI